jgi:hypothetical protein
MTDHEFDSQGNLLAYNTELWDDYDNDDQMPPTQRLVRKVCLLQNGDY